MPYPTPFVGLGLAGTLIIRCATTPIDIYPSCLVFSSCDSDVYIIYLFVSVVVDWPVLGLVVGRGLSPHYFNISVVEAGNCRTEKPYSFVPFGRCSAISWIAAYPPLGVSSQLPVHQGGSVGSLNYSLTVINWGYTPI